MKRQTSTPPPADILSLDAGVYDEASHREALATLLYTIAQSEGWALVTGQAGSGKTALLAKLQASLDGRVQCVHLSAEDCPTPMDLFCHIADALEMGVPCHYKARFLFNFRAYLEQCRRQGRKILILIDSAQKWGPEMLRELELLGNEDQFSPRVLNIFLFARPEFLHTLEGMGATNLKHHLRRFRRLAPPGASPAPQGERRLRPRRDNGIDYSDNEIIKELRQVAAAKAKEQRMAAQIQAARAKTPPPAAASPRAPAPKPLRAMAGGQTAFRRELNDLLDLVLGPAPFK